MMTRRVAVVHQHAQPLCEDGDVAACFKANLVSVRICLGCYLVRTVRLRVLPCEYMFWRQAMNCKCKLKCK